MRLSIENNLLSIDNYKQIMKLSSDLIQIEDLCVEGRELNVLYLDKFRIVIGGIFRIIILGESKNDIQNNNE